MQLIPVRHISNQHSQKVRGSQISPKQHFVIHQKHLENSVSFLNEVVYEIVPVSLKQMQVLNSVNNFYFQ